MYKRFWTSCAAALGARRTCARVENGRMRQCPPSTAASLSIEWKLSMRRVAQVARQASSSFLFDDMRSSDVYGLRAMLAAARRLLGRLSVGCPVGVLFERKSSKNP